MLQDVLRNSALVVGSIVAGVIGASAAGAFRGGAGLIQPSIFDASSLVAAIGAIVVASVSAMVIGILVGRFSNPAVGLFVAGWAFFGLAWRMGAMDTFIIGGGSVRGLAIETVIWAVVGGVTAAAVIRGAGELPDVEPTVDGSRPSPFASVAAIRFAAACVAALPVAWIVSRTPVVGQALGAAVVAGVGAGLAARLASPHIQPYLLVPAVVLVGAVALVVAEVRLGADAEAFVRMYGVPSPGPVHGLMWVAGGMIGGSMGLGWARGFLEHEDDPQKDAAPRPMVRRAAAYTPSAPAADLAGTDGRPGGETGA
ncbi:MAG: hypothetical protein AB8G96_03275 [Phycisphaerales bacterium]